MSFVNRPDTPQDRHETDIKPTYSGDMRACGVMSVCCQFQFYVLCLHAPQFCFRAIPNMLKRTVLGTVPGYRGEGDAECVRCMDIISREKRAPRPNTDH